MEAGEGGDKAGDPDFRLGYGLLRHGYGFGGGGKRRVGFKHEEGEEGRGGGMGFWFEPEGCNG